GLGVVVVVLIFVLISIDPPQVLFAAALLYALSGPLLTVWLLLRRRRQIKAGDHPDSDEDTQDGG
ncbi:MAG: CDP-diacylglycerol--serine O-phosphatidyltransferase, partial [Gammaproteobacteria bacterium]|nr:CDP-diacylglycerol--serine O-phosphatidyltransferase [Gammaproteobacteria bacterium]